MVIFLDILLNLSTTVCSTICLVLSLDNSREQKHKLLFFQSNSGPKYPSQGMFFFCEIIFSTQSGDI